MESRLGSGGCRDLKDGKDVSDFDSLPISWLGSKGVSAHHILSEIDVAFVLVVWSEGFVARRVSVGSEAAAFPVS